MFGIGARLLLGGIGLALAGSVHALTVGAAFRAEMDIAMHRMHAAMAIGYSGDTDRDFASMMIPHHQGAVEMAGIELRYGRDERLRRLAQGIIVEQQQEIALMRGILSAPHSPLTAPAYHRRDTK